MTIRMFLSGILGILTATLILTGPARSQGIGGIGIKAGYTSAGEKYKFKTAGFNPEPERRSGFTISAFVELFDLPSFSLLPQIEYTQKGMGMPFVEISPTGPEIIARYTIFNRLDYVSLPVLAKFRIPSESVVPYLFFGPRVDYLAGYSSDQGAFNEVYDRFKRFAFGGSAGAGVEAGKILNAPLLLEFRYNHDFTDSYDTELLEVSNNSFDILIGIGL